MTYIPECILVGLLAMLGIVAAYFQDFLTILSRDWRHGFAAKRSCRRKKTHSRYTSRRR